MAYDPQAPYAIKQFEIDVLVPIKLFGVDASFTTSAQAMVTTVIVICAYMALAVRDRALVPGRLQSSAEWIYGFIANVVIRNAGREAIAAIPFVFTLFVFLFVGSVVGVTPIKFTFTSHLIVTMALALVVFAYVNVVAFRTHGLAFLGFFRPAGTPLWLAPLIVVVEIISYLFRPVTLGVRIFVNIFAGHVIIKLFADMCVMLVDGLGPIGIGLTILPLILMGLFYLFEIVVFVVQSYIFVLLTSLYLKDAHHMGH